MQAAAACSAFPQQFQLESDFSGLKPFGIWGKCWSTLIKRNWKTIPFWASKFLRMYNKQIILSLIPKIQHKILAKTRGHLPPRRAGPRPTPNHQMHPIWGFFARYGTQHDPKKIWSLSGLESHGWLQLTPTIAVFDPFKSSSSSTSADRDESSTSGGFRRCSTMAALAVDSFWGFKWHKSIYINHIESLWIQGIDESVLLFETIQGISSWKLSICSVSFILKLTGQWEQHQIRCRDRGIYTS